MSRFALLISIFALIVAIAGAALFEYKRSWMHPPESPTVTHDPTPTPEEHHHKFSRPRVKDHKPKTTEYKPRAKEHKPREKHHWYHRREQTTEEPSSTYTSTYTCDQVRWGMSHLSKDQIDYYTGQASPDQKRAARKCLR